MQFAWEGIPFRYTKTFDVHVDTKQNGLNELKQCNNDQYGTDRYRELSVRSVFNPFFMVILLIQRVLFLLSFQAAVMAVGQITIQ